MSLWPYKLVSGTGSATVFHGLSQLFPPKRGDKARPQPGFYLTVHKRPVLGSSGASLAKRPDWESESETHLGGKSAGGIISVSSADSRRKGAMVVSTPGVSQSPASS